MESQEPTKHQEWITELLIRVDTKLQKVEECQIATLEQVKKTNGRVVELEKKNIEYDITIKFLKVAFGALLLPIFIALSTWGIQSFIQIAIK